MSQRHRANYLSTVSPQIGQYLSLSLQLWQKNGIGDSTTVNTSRQLNQLHDTHPILYY